MASGYRADTRAHQADAVEIGLLAGAFLGAFAGLVALVEQLDLLELLERLCQRCLGLFELTAQLVGRTRQIFAALDRSLGIGRISEVRGIVNPGALLFGLDFTLKVDRHALEVSNHGFDLGDPATFLVDLKFLQADQRFTRLHRLILPRSPNLNAGQSRLPGGTPPAYQLCDGDDGPTKLAFRFQSPEDFLQLLITVDQGRLFVLALAQIGFQRLVQPDRLVDLRA